jgi:hypothetical protein
MEILHYFQDYCLLRCDRKSSETFHETKKHGGCCILAPNRLAPKPVFSLSTGTCEIIAASLSKIKVLVIAIYRPGSATHAEFSLILQKRRHYLEQVKDEQEIWLLGDFNFPPRLLTWHNVENGPIPIASSGNTEEKASVSALLKLAHEYFLQQLVTEPTRKEHILDLVFTSNNTMAKA